MNKGSFIECFPFEVRNNIDAIESLKEDNYCDDSCDDFCDDSAPKSISGYDYEKDQIQRLKLECFKKAAKFTLSDNFQEIMQNAEKLYNFITKN